MAGYKLLPAALDHLDDIFDYTLRTWGAQQAEAYLRELFDAFDCIASGSVVRRAIPAEFEVDGHFIRHGHHFIYWRELPDNGIEIAAILHERMHQLDRFRDQPR
ncbi:MAG: type II toxin-antitoxin system RelE/ParE family toxin [Anderseniella sp.]|jgi:toxin ParE1/3/4|nr:type II toxin-antitoxin system RelE/ParE family toxin [Anderseniella sp.]